MFLGSAHAIQSGSKVIAHGKAEESDQIEGIPLESDIKNENIHNPKHNSNHPDRIVFPNG